MKGGIRHSRSTVCRSRRRADIVHVSEEDSSVLAVADLEEMSEVGVSYGARVLGCWSWEPLFGEEGHSDHHRRASINR